MWSLLRIWHSEALESVIDHPRGAHFLRTSYLTAPDHWRNLPQPELLARIEQILIASYRRRDWNAAQSDDPTRMVLFAFSFEWVERGGRPADPDAVAEPWVFPQPNAHPALVEGALAEFTAQLRSARPGIDSRAFARAFEVFRIDEDDSWHIVGYADQAALFADRFEHHQ